MEQPLVSVAVITYNLAKTVIETLDSIYNQTYQNLELVISDDCSIDGTVELCKQWIAKNQSRFVRTLLIVSEKNCGTSVNLNKAEDQCAGEWVKPIAGDDKLVSDCIESCVRYVEENFDVSFLFGKCSAFGADEYTCRSVDAMFDYSFFSMSKEEQLRRLVLQYNCVPATTFFYNRENLHLLGVKNDERIPLLEDWPKWINLLQKDAFFYFIDKVLVLYRVGGVSTSAMTSVEMFRSERLFYFYYLFPEWCKRNYDVAIKRMVDDEVSVFRALKEKETTSEAMLRKERDSLRVENNYLKGELNARMMSKSYRLGRMLLHPIDFLIKKLFCKSGI